MAEKLRRVFQDEINASEARKKTARSEERKAGDVGPISETPTPYAPRPVWYVRRVYGNVPREIIEALALGAGGGEFESIRYWNRDALGQDVYQVKRPNGSFRLLTYGDGGVGKPTFWEGPGTTPPGVPDIQVDPRVGYELGLTDTPTGGGGQSLEQVKSNWLAWITEMSKPGSITEQPLLMPETAVNLVRQINSWSGTAEELQEHMEFIALNTEGFPPSRWEPQYGDQPSYSYGSSGYGRGGGGPVYVSPDRRFVEEFVKGELRTLLGTIPSTGMVSNLVEVYLADHRKNFDTPEETIDPTYSVVEAIRNTTEYGLIHKHRPESQDERAWVAERQRAAARGGLWLGLQEDFAIQQAALGIDFDAAVEGAARQQFSASGTARGTPFEAKIRRVASSMMRGVV